MVSAAQNAIANSSIISYETENTAISLKYLLEHSQRHRDRQAL